MIPTTYELTDSGEASGRVHHYCGHPCQDEHARALRAEWPGLKLQVTAEPDDVWADMCDGEVCAQCEAPLEVRIVSAHTPGPWTAQASASIPIVRRRKMPNGEADTFVGTVFGLERAFVCRLDFGYGKKEDEANARLIAAAQDLLAALREILKGFDRGIFVRSIDDDANPAWAIKLFPYIQAMARGQAAITRVDGAK